MAPKPDHRPPAVVAIEWSTRITTVALEMVLPAVAGSWLDTKLGTRILFALLGAAAGLTLGIWHLIWMTK